MSRRTILKSATAAAALALAPGQLTKSAFAASVGKPSSQFNGVQIGCITYSYRSMPSSAEDILKYVVDCGISSIELMGDPAEQFAGAPGGKGKQMLDWRTSVSMDKYKALRKMYNDAGVNIHIVKFGDIGDDNMPDEQIEYYFNVAKALGARGITRELSESAAKRLGPLADKQKITIAMHNHTQLRPDTYDGPILDQGKYIGINFDIGHYVAGNNLSPIPLIEKLHDRILSLHIKDRKVNNGPNMPLGQGDTPLALILQLMKREKWTFPADIELEYNVSKESNAVAEVKKCVSFCKDVLA